MPGPKPAVLRARAHADVQGIVDHYLAEAGAETARRFIDRLESAFRTLGRQPGIGSPRMGHELGLPGLRSWPLSPFPYVVFYIEGDAALDVWRVLHAHSDLPDWLLS